MDIPLEIEVVSHCCDESSLRQLPGSPRTAHRISRFSVEFFERYKHKDQFWIRRHVDHPWGQSGEPLALGAVHTKRAVLLKHHCSLFPPSHHFQQSCCDPTGVDGLGNISPRLLLDRVLSFLSNAASSSMTESRPRFDLCRFGIQGQGRGRNLQSEGAIRG